MQIDRSFAGRAAYRSRLQQNPDDAEALHALATIAAEDHDYAEAEEYWRRSIRLKPDWTAARRGLGQMYLDWGRVGAAVAVLREGLARRADSLDLNYALGLALEDAGDREGAERCYRRAMALDPAWGAPLGALLMLLRERAGHAEVERAEKLLAAPATDCGDAALIAYGLGRVHEASGRYEAAFRALSRANAERRKLAGAFDVDALRRRTQATIEAFDPARLASFAQWPPLDGPQPIFVVGMPRSGTTLVERLLASHPRVTGFGESPELPRLARRMPEYCASLQDWPQAIGDCTPAAARLAAAAYREAVTGTAGSPTPFFIDKLPFNFQHLGLVAALFPAARVVVCRRDPRDVAVSIWAENFAVSQRYATSLADIAAYIAEFERLMAHWSAHAPLPITEVVYESLTEDPEAGVRALVQGVGLEWEPACLRFFEAGDAVQTPSRWQVRQPIYRSSVARWKRYEPWLGELFAALQRHRLMPE